MNLDELLVDLSGRGVSLQSDGGQLRVRAPKGVLTAELQRLIAARKSELLALLSQGSSPAPIEPIARDSALTMSFMQERLWFLSQMYPEVVAYTLPNAHRLSGPLDVAALHSAFDNLVARHESLRTTFTDDNGTGVQRIEQEARADFELIDLTATDRPALSDNETLQQQADKLAIEEANRPFDLERGPLLRIKLVRFSDDDHLLIWTLHHIISDGWSSMVILRELKALYEAAVSEKPASLPELPIQYADFAHWEREQLQGDALDAQLAYWREKFAGFDSVLELPTDHKRPSIIEYKGDFESIVLEKDLVDQARSLARECGCTLFVLLLAAFKVLLARYSGQNDICVGSPIARRSRPEIEDVVGCFINSLPLRTQLSPEQSFVELLDHVRSTSTGAFGHQDLPFEQLIESLNAQRDTSRTPLFQVMFILHVQDTRKVTHLGDVLLEPVEYHTRGSKFDLTLELKETVDGLEGFIEYSSDLFEAQTIQRMGENLKTLLLSAVADAHRAIGTLDLIHAPEYAALKAIGEHSEESIFPDPNDETLPSVVELIEEQAHRSPDAIAVRGAGATLDYASLNKRSNQLANFLRAQGVENGDLVGVYLDRSPEMLVVILAIMKAGAAYLPLDPAFPSDRLSFMIEDASVALVVTESVHLDSLPQADTKWLDIDTCHEQVAELPTDSACAAPSSNNLAYVIYTSGSTGKPKGVQIPHRALSNFLLSMRERPGITSDDVLLAVTTLSFDIAGLELYLPLISGAQVVIATREQATDARQLQMLLEESSATVMQATPATWQLLLSAGWTGSGELKILCGGEALSRDLADRLLSCRGVSLWNMYGPTETTIWSAVERVLPGDSAIAIGTPIANTQLYVLDENLQMVPKGVIGELFIGGTGLADGYLNRPELTAERFVSSPFVEGERLYRTGDQARFVQHPNGETKLLVLGRADFQVKVRGYRIELGEIEASLIEHDAITDAVVIVREDQPGDQRLVAYTIGKEISANELRQHLAGSLPEYMLPSSYVALERFPMTDNAKVNRNALPRPDGSERAKDAGYAAPETELQSKLATLWAEVLGLENVGIRDNFFELGGHSMLALRLVARMEVDLDLEVPVIALFQGQSIEDIAAASEQEEANFSRAVQPIRRRGKLAPFFAVGSHPLYAEVANQINNERPFYRLDVYALQSERIAKGLPIHSRVDSLCEEFVNAVQAIQPHGPYFIGGGCEGALTAFAVATELQRRGEVVEKLVIWITPAPGYGGGAVFGGPGTLRITNQLKALVHHLRVADMKLSTIKRIVGHEYLEYRIFKAMDSYAPKAPFDGDIFLARTVEERPAWDTELPMGWDELSTGDVHIYELKGNHDTWLADYTEDFSRVLDGWLH